MFVRRVLCFGVLLALTAPLSSVEASAMTGKNHKSRHRMGGKRGRDFQSGGVLKMCMDDESSEKCDGRQMMLRVERLIEVDPEGNEVQRSANFKNANYPWSTPVEKVVNGSNVTETKLVITNLRVGNVNDNRSTNFTLITHLYGENATTLNGDQVIDILEGSVKFTLEIGSWPFQSVNNSLTFGVNLKIKDRQGGNGTKTAKRQRLQDKLERLELGDGMFLDSSNQSYVDGVKSNTSARMKVTVESIEIDWTFDHFDSTLYYDPVMGATEAETMDENSSASIATHWTSLFVTFTFASFRALSEW